MSNKLVYVIIPCFNESANIRQTVEKLLAVRSDCIAVVVDDGSMDNSVAEIRAIPDKRVVLLELPFNCGIGTAVETGLIYAARKNADYAVKFDGDGQHLAEEIDLLMEVLEKDEADMALGSRFISDIDGFKSTYFRRVGISFFRMLSGLLTGQAIADSTSGFRAYNRSALKFVSKNYPAFDYPEPEENILLLRNKFRIKEVPCRMNIREGGRSSIRSLKACYYMIKVALSMIMAALRPPIEKKGK